MSAYGRQERPEVPQEGPGGGRGGSTVASVTLFDHYMLIWSGFRPQMLGTIINDGPGGMETIRDMRLEPLHPDLYAAPATENDVITRTMHGLCC